MFCRISVVNKVHGKTGIRPSAESQEAVRQSHASADCSGHLDRWLRLAAPLHRTQITYRLIALQHNSANARTSRGASNLSNSREPYSEIAIAIPVVKDRQINIPVLPMLFNGFEGFGAYVVDMPVTSFENQLR